MPLGVQGAWGVQGARGVQEAFSVQLLSEPHWGTDSAANPQHRAPSPVAELSANWTVYFFQSRYTVSVGGLVSVIALMSAQQSSIRYIASTVYPKNESAVPF